MPLPLFEGALHMYNNWLFHTSDGQEHNMCHVLLWSGLNRANWLSLFQVSRDQSTVFLHTNDPLYTDLYFFSLPLGVFITTLSSLPFYDLELLLVLQLAPSN